MKRLVEAWEQCEMHMRSQRSDPHKLVLEYVSWSMQAIDIDFFKQHGSKYLLLINHFSGMPMYEH